MNKVYSEDDFDIVSYSIYTKKLNTDEEVKVILIADLHNYLKNSKKSSKLADIIKRIKPHHIVIAGDIIQGSKWEKETISSPFSTFIKEISEVAPVFISQGNHDLVGIDNSEKRQQSFKRLEEINPGKVFSLINDRITYDNFDIFGYTPNPKIVSGLAIQEHGIAHDMFINEYMKYGKKVTASDHIVEFVGHNPFLIAKSENGIGLGDLKYVDTFYAGHLHNGYRRSQTIQRNPDKYLDYGYVEKPYLVDKNNKFIKSSFNPLFWGKTTLCRGTIYLDDDANCQILQLRNNNYYMNNHSWKKIDAIKAKEKVINLHALVITGGIRKFFGFSIPGDKPEITMVIYKGLN